MSNKLSQHDVNTALPQVERPLANGSLSGIGNEISVSGRQEVKRKAANRWARPRAGPAISKPSVACPDGKNVRRAYIVPSGLLRQRSDGFTNNCNTTNKKGEPMGQKQPIHRISLGRIRAAIWSNQNGDGSEWFSVTIVRRYQNEGEWKDATNYSRDDLPLVRQAADMVHAKLCQLDAKEAAVEQTESDAL